MINSTQIASIPAIVVIVYLILYAYKSIIGMYKTKEIFLNIIPVIAGVLGTLLGILIYFTSPELLPADNVITAILVGMVSGLAATGTHQAVKQLVSLQAVKDETNKDDEINKDNDNI